MILTRRTPEVFKREGYALVQATDIAHYERLGVPLYMGRWDDGRPTGPYAPVWALSLLASLSPLDLDAEDAVKRVISLAIRQDDPREFAEYADGAARLGGTPALRAILEGARP